jgi:hypothetical protein
MIFATSAQVFGRMGGFIHTFDPGRMRRGLYQFRVGFCLLLQFPETSKPNEGI